MLYHSWWVSPASPIHVELCGLQLYWLATRRCMHAALWRTLVAVLSNKVPGSCLLLSCPTQYQVAVCFLFCPTWCQVAVWCFLSCSTHYQVAVCFLFCPTWYQVAVWCFLSCPTQYQVAVCLVLSNTVPGSCLPMCLHCALTMLWDGNSLMQYLYCRYTRKLSCQETVHVLGPIKPMLHRPNRLNKLSFSTPDVSLSTGRWGPARIRAFTGCF